MLKQIIVVYITLFICYLPAYFYDLSSISLLWNMPTMPFHFDIKEIVLPFRFLYGDYITESAGQLHEFNSVLCPFFCDEHEAQKGWIYYWSSQNGWMENTQACLVCKPYSVASQFHNYSFIFYVFFCFQERMLKYNIKWIMLWASSMS